jgi:hypothetical protein
MNAGVLAVSFFPLHAMRPVICISLFCALTWLLAGVGHANEGRVEVFRTFMPGAGPSAFGVVLRPALALCYDPLRGGVNQVWEGTLDLKPTLQAKINQPAQVQGRVFYQETTVQPLRVDDAGKVPERRFKGYRYGRSSVTFEYTLDGVPIHETLSATEDGRGLQRVFNLPPEVTLYLIADAQVNAEVTFEGGTEVSPGVWKLTGAPGAVFSVKIQPRRRAR